MRRQSKPALNGEESPMIRRTPTRRSSSASESKLSPPGGTNRRRSAAFLSAQKSAEVKEGLDSPPVSTARGNAESPSEKSEGALSWQPSLGDRCCFGAAPGTVRFIGATLFAEGIWVGVELDEPQGKNDGSVRGQRYFDSKPLHGIFCRISALSQFDATESMTFDGSRSPSEKSPGDGNWSSSSSSYFLDSGLSDIAKAASLAPKPRTRARRSQSEAKLRDDSLGTKRHVLDAKAGESLLRLDLDDVVEDHDTTGIRKANPKVAIGKLRASKASSGNHLQHRRSGTPLIVADRASLEASESPPANVKSSPGNDRQRRRSATPLISSDRASVQALESPPANTKASAGNHRQHRRSGTPLLGADRTTVQASECPRANTKASPGNYRQHRRSGTPLIGADRASVQALDSPMVNSKTSLGNYRQHRRSGTPLVRADRASIETPDSSPAEKKTLRAGGSDGASMRDARMPQQDQESEHVKAVTMLGPESNTSIEARSMVLRRSENASSQAQDFQMPQQDQASERLVAAAVLAPRQEPNASIEASAVFIRDSDRAFVEVHESRAANEDGAAMRANTFKTASTQDHRPEHAIPKHVKQKVSATLSSSRSYGLEDLLDSFDSGDLPKERIVQESEQQLIHMTEPSSSREADMVEIINKSMTRLQVGDRVVVRDHYHTSWKRGVVQSANPLKVKPDGWVLSFPWAQVGTLVLSEESVPLEVQNECTSDA